MQETRGISTYNLLPILTLEAYQNSLLQVDVDKVGTYNIELVQKGH